MSNTDVIELAAPAPARRKAQPAPTPALLLQMAVQQGADLDKLEKLMELQDRWEKNEAKKAFDDAMADFKAESIEIIKRKLVDFTTAKGRTTYKHAELSDVIEAVGPSLSRHGFSWSWTPKQDRGWIDITCTLKHRLGHSESVTLGAPPDESGGKNTIQSIVSTTTYLERHTLKAVCGVSEKGDDTDGHAPTAAAAPEIDEAKLQAGRDAAMQGMAAVTAWWGSLNAPERKALNNEFRELRKVAARADQGG